MDLRLGGLFKVENWPNVAINHISPFGDLEGGQEQYSKWGETMSVNKLIPMPMHVDISWYILSIHKNLPTCPVEPAGSLDSDPRVQQWRQPHCNVVEWCLVRLSKGIYSDIQHAVELLAGEFAIYWDILRFMPRFMVSSCFKYETSIPPGMKML